MTQLVQIKKDIYWIGVLDDKLEVFDIIMETKYGTTYNSYLINTTEGAVLVETVKERFFDSYLQHIKSVIGNDLTKIKYLISNHTEPDHAGSIGKLLEVIPDITIVASRTAVSYIVDIINREFNYRTAEQIKELKIGGKTFEFIPAPFLHWPDSMYSYLHEDKTLFTCDSFGSHYSPKKSIKMSELGQDEEAGYQDALLYYYTAIFGPFKDYVIKAYEKIKDIDFDCICDGHGPVLDARAKEIVEIYHNWSLPPKAKATKSIVIPYVSAYGYTEEVAQSIVQGIKEVDPKIEVFTYNIHIKNFPELKGEITQKIAEADGVLLGTNTINGDAIPFIWDLALGMNPITHGGKVVSSFGSYGWSGEGVDNICDRLNQIRCKVIDGFKIKFRQSQKDKEEAVAFGKLFANCVLTGEVPKKPKKTQGKTDWVALNPTGKIVLWRCIVCGEIYAGPEPPAICPACGVDQELFELYTPEDIKFHSDAAEKIVIIGGGVAAVSAAEAARARNDACDIKIISREPTLPYYRPILSDYIHKKVPQEEFILHPIEWYHEKKIELLLNTNASAVDNDKKIVICENRDPVHFDKLIYACGASPTIPNFPGINQLGVFSIRTDIDVQSVQQYAVGKKVAAVIGGGVLGLETVDALLQIGLEVHVIEFFKRLMPRQLDEAASALLLTQLEKKGVKCHLNASTKELLGQEGVVKQIVLADGTVIDAEMVIINIGVRANIQLAKESGVTCDRCIVVDEHMQTNLPHVFACGDCAEHKKMCQALWSPAIAQGSTAGANAVGDKKTFEWAIEPLTMLAFDIDLLSIGCVPQDTTGMAVVSDIDESTGKLRRLYFKDNKLVYAVFFNSGDKTAVAIQGVRLGHDHATVMAQLYQ